MLSALVYLPTDMEEESCA